LRDQRISAEDHLKSSFCNTVELLLAHPNYGKGGSMHKWLIVLGIGGVIFLIGVLVLVVGKIESAKAGDLASAPQVKTGDAAAKGAAIGDKNGLVTVAGTVKCPSPLESPVAGTPCLFYNHTIKANWQETSLDSTTGKQKTENKSDTVLSESKAAEFSLDDGSGPLPVALKELDGLDLESSPSSTFKDTDAGRIRSLGKTKLRSNTTYTESEQILKPMETLTAHGKLESGAIGPDNLLLSTKTRDQLLAEKVSTAGMLLTTGWVGLVLGLIVGVVGFFLRPSSKPLAAAAKPVA
jgi:hypothetical protein